MSNGAQVARELLQGSFPRDREKFFRQHIRPQQSPWSFSGHEYLRAIVNDQSQRIVVQKAAQVGCSTMAEGIALHEATMGRQVGYYFPDRDRLNAFIQGHFDPLVNSDPALADAVTEGKAYDQLGDGGSRRLRRKSADNLRLKHCGPGTIWFMGIQKRADVKSLPLDMFVLDEVDEVNQGLAVWLRDRLLHSHYKRRLELSQPSVPDWGINARYQASNQQVYQLRCARCRTWHCLEQEWPHCLQRHQGVEWRIVCLKCGARLRETSANIKAEWVATHPDRSISGYRLSQIYGPATTAAELAADWAATERSRDELESFTISILGLPFAGDRQPLSDQVLSEACGDWGLSRGAYVERLNLERGGARPLVVAGVDVGDLLHLVIGVYWQDTLAVVHIEEIRDDWALLAKRLADVDFCVIDAMPYKTSVKSLLRGGINGAMSYLTASQFSIDYEDKDLALPVRITRDDRTSFLDDMVEAIKTARLRLPHPRHDAVQALMLHCKALVKDLDAQSGKYAYKRGVENHYGMALGYLWQALTVATTLGLGPRQPLDPETMLFGGPVEPALY